MTQKITKPEQSRCRVCLETKTELIPLSTPAIISDSKLRLYELLSFCCNLHIAFDDDKPHTMCLTCAREAVISYKFKTRCENSDRILKNEIRNVEEKEKCVEAECEEKECEEKECDEKECEEKDDEIDEFESGPFSGRSEESLKVSLFDEEENLIPINDIFEQMREESIEAEEYNRKYGLKNVAKEISQFQFVSHMVNSGDFDFNSDQENQDETNEKIDEASNHKFVFTPPEEKKVEKKEEKTEKKKHSCQQCSFTGSTSLLLGKHMDQNHPELKNISCPDCGKKFFRRCNLNQHMRIHQGKKFDCDICGAAFSLAHNLDVHKRLHTGEKPYSCKICKKTFAQAGTLKYHEASHTKDREYVCGQCGLGFTRLRALKVHLKRHTDSRPYKCHYCDKTFPLSSDRSGHMKVHTGVKSFSCHICEKKFLRATTLKIHVMTHTGLKPYNCDLCKKGFVQKNRYVDHMSRHKK